MKGLGYLAIVGLLVLSLGCGKENPNIPQSKGLLQFEAKEGLVSLTIADSLEGRLRESVSVSRFEKIVWESYNLHCLVSVDYDGLPILVKNILLDTLGYLRGNCYVWTKDSMKIYLDLEKWDTYPSGGIVDDGQGGLVIQLQFPAFEKGLITFDKLDTLRAIAVISDSIGARLMSFVSDSAIDSVGFGSDVYGWYPAGLKQKYTGLPVTFTLQGNLNKIIRGNFFVVVDSEAVYFNLKKWKTLPENLIVEDGQGGWIIEFRL